MKKKNRFIGSEMKRGMTDVDQVHHIVMRWAEKYGELYRLKPSRSEYKKKTRARFHEVMRDRIPSMRLETLKEKNPELYKELNHIGAI